MQACNRDANVSPSQMLCLCHGHITASLFSTLACIQTITLTPTWRFLDAGERHTAAAYDHGRAPTSCKPPHKPSLIILKRAPSRTPRGGITETYFHREHRQGRPCKPPLDHHFAHDKEEVQERHASSTPAIFLECFCINCVAYRLGSHAPTQRRCVDAWVRLVVEPALGDGFFNLGGCGSLVNIFFIQCANSNRELAKLMILHMYVYLYISHQ